MSDLKKKKRPASQKTRKTASKRAGRSRRKKHRGLRFYGMIAALFLVAGVAGYRVFFDHPFEQGMAYLEAQESKDIAKLEKTIYDTQINRLIEGVEDGSRDVFDIFNNALILGDSRVMGFSAYGYLPDDKVLAGTGYTIEHIPEFIDTVKNVQPQLLFISYGVNDLGMEIGKEDEENGYGLELEKQVKSLVEVSPESTIIINSVIPSSTATMEAQPTWQKWQDFNRQIKAVCERNKWIYIDNDDLADGGKADIYGTDGIHFPGDFYPVWTENMFKQTVKALTGQEGSENKDLTEKEGSENKTQTGQEESEK